MDSKLAEIIDKLGELKKHHDAVLIMAAALHEPGRQLEDVASRLAGAHHSMHFLLKDIKDLVYSLIAIEFDKK